MNSLGYVSVDKLIEFANNHIAGIDANDIARFPKAEVEEVRHGKIIKTGRVYPYCSECDANLQSESYRYCPWCGAKMDKEKE